MTAPKRARRSKREVTMEAMLDAAERLFSELGFTAVSVRDIAAAAGVSHALVHRYLGSKDEIYRAVLRRHEEVLRDSAAGTDDLDEALSLMFREGLAHQREYLRLIAHSALHGLPYEATMGRFRATERLIELAEARTVASAGGQAGDLEPRVVIAAIVSLYLGWVAMEPWLTRAAGLEDLGRETIEAGLERIIRDIADREVPGADG